MTHCIIIMGVSGSGKTSLAQKLAAHMKVEFIEADDFHPAQNVAHMNSGKALTDEMRIPWIHALIDRVSDLTQNQQGFVMSYSGLRKSHRDLFKEHCKGCKFIMLNLGFDVIKQRLTQRKNHFMPTSLLESQFEALDMPTDNEPYIQVINGDASVDALLAQTFDMLNHWIE
ncbi:gluconokinase [Echinimonas agarilytica]|uniref:Gluconokinase n=1 Tax=Echinimonas agarilytica TaxID=1215918 RepID=A0AA41WB37_9GAMM|nr:gluconokinase, GntK/IdnK-type [Echinimonas agarilytica]MCM2681213.1 gluconokinase, GntK/IdnK-type [Echinimonas agarilytica]